MASAELAHVDASAVRRFLTFRAAESLYALPAEQVSEVIHLPALSRIPQSPAALLGLANLRGAVVPVVGLRELLGTPDKAPHPLPTKAIVLDVGAPVALAVELVQSLVTVSEDRIEVREAELAAGRGELLSGAFRADANGTVAKILDIESLLGAAFAQRGRKQRQARTLNAAVARPGVSEPAVAGVAAMLVTFEVAGQEFALGLDSVQEILPAPAVLMAVPRAEDVVLGVTSLRNRLLPLLSLRGLLGFPPAPTTDGREKVVVARVGGTQVGLVADRAKAIVAAHPSTIDPIPSVLAARTGGEARIKSIYRGDEGRRLISILAPDQLFREDVMRRLSHGYENEAHAPAAALSHRDELNFVVFRLGDDEFGLPIEAVDEVGEIPATITRMPKTPKFLEGVVNLRGDVLPVIDQRRRFDMPANPSARRRLVVVRSEGHRAGLIVDNVSDVLRVPASSVEPAPELTDQIARLVRGVINLEKSQRMVLVLDPAELLTPAERGRLDAFQKAAQANA